MIVLEWVIRQVELRITEFGQTYVDKNRTSILFSCKEIAET